jgi:hypothetical protein
MKGAHAVCGFQLAQSKRFDPRPLSRRDVNPAANPENRIAAIDRQARPRRLRKRGFQRFKIIGCAVPEGAERQRIDAGCLRDDGRPRLGRKSADGPRPDSADQKFTPSEHH